MRRALAAAVAGLIVTGGVLLLSRRALRQVADSPTTPEHGTECIDNRQDVGSITENAKRESVAVTKAPAPPCAVQIVWATGEPATNVEYWCWRELPNWLDSQSAENPSFAYSDGRTLADGTIPGGQLLGARAVTLRPCDGIVVTHRLEGQQRCVLQSLGEIQIVPEGMIDSGPWFLNPRPERAASESPRHEGAQHQWITYLQYELEVRGSETARLKWLAGERCEVLMSSECVVFEPSRVSGVVPFVATVGIKNVLREVVIEVLGSEGARDPVGGWAAVCPLPESGFLRVPIASGIAHVGVGPECQSVGVRVLLDSGDTIEKVVELSGTRTEVQLDSSMRRVALLLDLPREVQREDLIGVVLEDRNGALENVREYPRVSYHAPIMWRRGRPGTVMIDWGQKHVRAVWGFLRDGRTVSWTHAGSGVLVLRVETFERVSINVKEYYDKWRRGHGRLVGDVTIRLRILLRSSNNQEMWVTIERLEVRRSAENGFQWPVWERLLARDMQWEIAILERSSEMQGR